MKIKKLKIDSYLHLKDLEFDFTYPEGHKRVGEPLEKICFIGQSATGKTQILNLIRSMIKNVLELEIVGNSLSYRFDKIYINGTSKIEFEDENKFYIFDQNSLDIYDFEGNTIKKLKFNDRASGTVENIGINRRDIIFNFSSDIISKHNLELFNISPNNVERKTFNETFKNINDFNSEYDSNHIISLLRHNIEHKNNYAHKVRNLFEKGLGQDMKALSREMDLWNLKNPNPIKEISKRLGKLFDKLFIEIDDIDVERTIAFRDKRTQNSIPLDSLSTGTKSLLLYLIPLFLSKPFNSILLVDEPERSLFPDIQMEIVENIKNLTKDSQLFVATHSPFIAASFEPEERFIFSFDEYGNVKLSRGISPVGDDPNDLLKNDFGINYINKYGQEAFQQYKDLKQKIYFEKDSKKKSEISKKLETIGEKYNF